LDRGSETKFFSREDLTVAVVHRARVVVRAVEAVALAPLL
jgi:hypothetical protein